MHDDKSDTKQLAGVAHVAFHKVVACINKLTY